MEINGVTLVGGTWEIDIDIHGNIIGHRYIRGSEPLRGLSSHSITCQCELCRQKVNMNTIKVPKVYLSLGDSIPIFNDERRPIYFKMRGTDSAVIIGEAYSKYTEIISEALELYNDKQNAIELAEVFKGEK